MTPRSDNALNSSRNGEALKHDNKTKPTVVVEPREGPPYVRCNSSDTFVNPTVAPTMSAKEVNANLNLNLGLPIDPNNTKLRKTLRWLSNFFLIWWEHHFFAFWDKVPLIIRQKLTIWAWNVYLPLHKYMLGRKTAIHPAASEEYHALTTFMWWGRLFPVTIKRMRFALSQLSVCHPRKGPNYSDIRGIKYEMKEFLDSKDIDKGQLDTTVTGYYVQKNDAPSKKVVFWLYGGAYLAGDAKGNTTIAESVGQACDLDVFLPDFGLMPECEYSEILWDVLLGYVYLVMVRGVAASDIIFLGISSGGGLVTRCLQAVAEVGRGDDFECKHIESLLSQCLKDRPLMPSGGVLVCPFVDYTESKGAFEEYPEHDLIVNQSVIEVGVPYFEIKLGSMENRRRTSPVYRSFEGLPPLCVVLSEHEVIYDQAVELVNRARSQGVSVTVGVWKYMCHVFCFLSTFIPEGEQSMDFVCDWIRQHHQNGSGND